MTLCQLPEEAAELLSRMLSPAPAARPAASEACSAPFFTDESAQDELDGAEITLQARTLRPPPARPAQAPRVGIGIAIHTHSAHARTAAAPCASVPPPLP